ncbi:MAG: CDP-alcohol phosphatidyltransferase family protein [Bacteroidota bacterium]
MLKHLPNAITSLNLLCGCVAVLFAISGDLIATSVFAILGIFFDFFDGLAARLLNAQSKLGLQLDSLADMITSGLVPGIVMVKLMEKAYGVTALPQSASAKGTLEWDSLEFAFDPLIGLLIVVASAYRLAKFNIDTRQTDSFIGLPTPANTLLILSLAVITVLYPEHWVSQWLQNPWVLIGITVASCILLNAEIRLFALKFKTWDVKSNAKRYIFLLLCLVALVLLKFLAIPLIIVLYIVMSLLWKEPA